MAEQVILAVGDMCGPPRKNPGAVATAALARRIIGAHPSAMILALAMTLDAIVASGECCSVSDDGKIDVEQAAFILEGIRDGLDNAHLDEGSAFVQRDIERLNDVVFRYNSAAGQAAG